MTRALVLFAHPCHESFSHALYQAACGALQARGWEVDGLDLYGEGFAPALSAAERREYHDIGANTQPVAAYVERLRAAQALVLVFPVWNFGYPAILKGFLDRVFLPGVSFALRDGRVQGNLRQIRRLAAVTTYGGSRARAWLCGDPPRKSVTRHVRGLIHPAARLRYLALYDMNRADAAMRGRFLTRSAAALARL